MRALVGLPIKIRIGENVKHLGSTDNQGKFLIAMPYVMQCHDFRTQSIGENIKVQIGDREVEIPAGDIALAIMSPEERQEYQKIVDFMKQGQKIGPALAYSKRFPEGCFATSVRAYVARKVAEVYQGVAEITEDNATLPSEICSGNPQLQRGEKVFLYRKPNGWNVATTDGRCEGTTITPFQAQFTDYLDPLGTQLREQEEVDRLDALTRECNDLFEQARQKQGIKPLQDLMDLHGDRCPQSVIETVRTALCKRRWKLSPLSPSPARIPAIRQFLQECPTVQQAVQAEEKAMRQAAAPICLKVKRAKNINDLQVLETKGREFDEKYGRPPWCMDEIERYIAAIRESNRPKNECEGMSFFRCMFHLGRGIQKAGQELEEASERAGMGPIWKGRGSSSRPKPTREQKKEDTDMKRIVQRVKDKEKCKRNCSINYRDNCGKGASFPLPVPLPSVEMKNTPQRCEELHSDCVHICEKRHGD